MFQSLEGRIDPRTDCSWLKFQEQMTFGKGDDLTWPLVKD